MKESHNEGVATPAGPESCGGGSNVTAEALTGVRAGQVLSREILFNFLGCRRCGTVRKATSDISVSRDIFGPCAVGDLVHVRKHFTREPGDPMLAFGWRVTKAAVMSGITIGDIVQNVFYFCNFCTNVSEVAAKGEKD